MQRTPLKRKTPLKPKRRVERVCAIDGCSSPVLARGWCGRHYRRWQTNGAPTALHPRLKGDPNSPVVEDRWVNGTHVFLTEDGRTFTLALSRGLPSRRYGEVFTCETCASVTFARYSGANRFRFCSHKCAGPEHRNNKLGKPKAKRPSSKTMKDGLDRLFSAIVRSVGVCQSCGATEDHQCAHGFSRRYLHVRWDLRNGFCLCRPCHMRYTHRPIEWDDWLRERWGEDLYWEIRHEALRTDAKVDYDAVRVGLVAEIRRLNITLRKLPKGVAGWTGITNDDDEDLETLKASLP